MASLKYNYWANDALHVTTTLSSPFTSQHYRELVFTLYDNGTEPGEPIDVNDFVIGEEGTYEIVEPLRPYGSTITWTLSWLLQVYASYLYCYALTAAGDYYYYVGRASVATPMLPYVTCTEQSFTRLGFEVDMAYAGLVDGESECIYEPGFVLQSYDGLLFGTEHSVDGYPCLRITFGNLAPNRNYTLQVNYEDWSPALSPNWCYKVYKYSDESKYDIYYVPPGKILSSNVRTDAELTMSVYRGTNSVLEYVSGINYREIGNCSYFHYVDYPNVRAKYENMYGAISYAFTSGLTPGDQYRAFVDVYCSTEYGEGHASCEQFITTLLWDDVRLECSTDGDSVTVQVVNAPSDITRCTFYYCPVDTLGQTNSYRTTETVHTYGGLSPGRYVACCSVTSSSGRYLLCEPFEITETEDPIAPFEWDTEKNAGEDFSVTADEWNRLGDTTTQTLIKNGYDTSYYPIATVSTGDTFHHDRFNEMRQAIGSMNSTGIEQKTSGNSILADDLNTLRDKLNEKI